MLPDDKLNIHRALRVFHRIHEQGEVVDGQHCLNGIYAQTDFDGYTVTLSNKDVELSIFFHNKYQLTSKNDFALQDFLNTLKILDK